MKAPMIVEPTSLSTNELAECISKEHQACRSAAQSAVQHAIRAGELLLEAKSKIPHGQWLSWLEGNCGVAERTAQAYMRLARELPKLEPGKAQCVADLPIREALSAIAEGEAQVESLHWIDAVFPSEFGEETFPDDSLDWTLLRLLHQIGVPDRVIAAISAQLDYDLPALRLCEGNDLIESLKLLAPAAKGERKFAVANGLTFKEILKVAITLQLSSQRAFVLVWDELAHRRKTNDDRHYREAEETCAALTARIDARRAETAEVAP